MFSPSRWGKTQVEVPLGFHLGYFAGDPGPTSHPKVNNSVFLGEYSHSLDSKGRLTIPAKFREQLATGLIVTRNPLDRCLLVMPEAKWSEVAEKISALPLADPRSALLRRAIFSAAEDYQPDKQGRILISQRLRDYAQIQGEIVVAGVHTFVELWNPDLWRERVLQQLDSGAVDGDLFAALNV